MKLLKYTIGGKIKPEEEQEKWCEHCKNGQIFLESEQKELTDMREPKRNEYGCMSCMTRYYIPRPISESFLKQHSFYISELLEKFMEEFKMIETEKLLERIKTFNDTGVCNHVMVTSNPIKTPNGEVSFQSCRICKKAKANISGKLHEGDLNSLIQIAMQGTKLSLDGVLPSLDFEVPDLDIPIDTPDDIISDIEL